MTFDSIRQKESFRPSRTVIAVAAFVALIITAVAWTVFYLPVLFPYALEVSVQSTAPASAQVYFDRGDGLHEQDSSSQRVPKGTTLVHLPMPAGSYQALRFDPIDRGGNVRFGELSIVSRRGVLIKKISVSDLIPNSQVGSLRMNEGMIEMASTPDANDPQLSILFSPPLELKFSTLDQILAGWLWLLSWFLGSFFFLLLVENTWRHRQKRSERLIKLSRERPRLALALFAAFTAILSSYPVVFFGKSFVSPNTTHLLYDSLPSVPGYTDARSERPRGADIGAMMWQHLPYTVQQSAALRKGELPLWNRFASCGVTLFGQGQSMLGDPLHFLVILTGGATWAFDVQFVLVKALFACGLGWCVWALTRDFSAAALLTFASGFIAFFNYRLCHPSIFTMGYSPWILVAWLFLSAAPDRRSFRHGLLLWFLANWMVLSSGTIKEAYMLACALNFTGGMIFLTSACPRAEKGRRILILSLAGGAFILAASPLWWSFLEALSSAYTAYDVPGLGQIPGGRLVGLFDDIFYREFMPKHDVFKPAANFLVFLGCLCAILRARRLAGSRSVLIVAVVSLASIALAFRFGPPSWAPTWLLAIPFIGNIYNLDTIFSCVAIVHLCVLAGWGFSAARESLAAPRGPRYMLAIAIGLFALFIPYFIANPPYPLPSHVWDSFATVTVDQAITYVHVIVLPLAALVLVQLARSHLRGKPLSGGTACVALVALLVLLGRHGLHLPVIRSTLVAAPATRAGLLQTSPAVRFLQERTAEEPARVLGARRYLFAGFTSVYGLEQITGVNALENRRHRQFVDAAGLVPFGEWIYEMPASAIDRWLPIANFLNARYLGAPDKFLTSNVGYHKVASLDLDIFESDHAWPRAFFTSHLEHYASVQQLVDTIRRRADGPPFAMIQDGDPVPLTFSSSEGPTVVAAKNYALTTNTTAFTVIAPSPGYAVLQENWLPDDFHATLDGQEVPYFRVNHTFKAIAIPTAGMHRVEFVYWPRGFTRSLLASLIGLLLFLAALFSTRLLRSGLPERASLPAVPA